MKGKGEIWMFNWLLLRTEPPLAWLCLWPATRTCGIIHSISSFTFASPVLEINIDQTCLLFAFAKAILMGLSS